MGDDGVALSGCGDDPRATEIGKLLHGLLHPAERQRLSAKRAAKLPFFNGFNWAALESRSLPAPHPPKMKSKLDTSQFKGGETARDFLRGSGLGDGGVVGGQDDWSWANG